VTKACAVLVAWVLAAGTTAAQAPATTGPAARQGEIDKGRKLYVSYGCYQCHGYEAQGSTATGPRLGPKPIPLAPFSRYVRQPSGQMPPYTAKVLRDAEIAAIYAFVESRPAPRSVESIPLLK
jgi:ubiquinol-cytochrome c reductase cytochrome c subunit